MAFLIFNLINFLNILLIILPFFLISCSVERNDSNASNAPAWVSKQLYLALADEAY